MKKTKFKVIVTEVSEFVFEVDLDDPDQVQLYCETTDDSAISVLKPQEVIDIETFNLETGLITVQDWDCGVIPIIPKVTAIITEIK